MAKMTTARPKRWQASAEKALKEIRSILTDLGDAKVNSSGGAYSDVIEIASHLIASERTLTVLVDEDPNRSPIARIRQRLEDASAARKAAAEERAAAKAAAGG